MFALVALYRHGGSDVRAGFWWYLPLLALCWALGALLARFYSDPSDRAVRRRWLRSSAVDAGGLPAVAPGRLNPGRE